MSKYERLRRYLQSISSDIWRASFADVEAILGFSLPDSARKYAAWWANQTPPLSQTSSWVDAGWQTEDVDLGSLRVAFRRVTSPASGVRFAPRNPLVQPAIVSSRRALSLSPHAWDGPARVSIQAQFEWKPIGRIVLDHARRLAFPLAQATPGLYRFRLLIDGKEARYIGETDNLSRRFAHYRNPGSRQETNIRINARFLDALAGGAEIAVAVVTENALIDLGDGLTPVDLGSKAIRRLLENTSLLAGGGSDIEMLNRGE